MTPGGSGSRDDNITSDQTSPREGVATMAENDEAMTPDGEPGTASEDPTGRDGGGVGTQAGGAGPADGRTTPKSADEADGESPYRDEEE